MGACSRGACSRGRVNHNQSKTDECPPNIYKRNVRIRTANFGKRPLDGLWLKLRHLTHLMHAAKGAIHERAGELGACKLFTNTKASSIHQQIATRRTAVLSSHACVLYTAYKLYKYKSIINQPTDSNQNTESPILFRSYRHETPFSDQKWASKIWDSVLMATHRTAVDQITESGESGRLLQNVLITLPKPVVRRFVPNRSELPTPGTLRPGYFQNCHRTFRSCVFPWLRPPGVFVHLANLLQKKIIQPMYA
jgi:hypothetical protein